MATLKIRKSENEVIELPLTTEKPIARSLAVFYNGEVYYCPLAFKNDYLSSGIMVRCDGFNHALPTSIYDPVTHGTKVEMWLSKGTPAVHERKYLELDGSSYLTSNKSFSLEKASYFDFSCNFTPTALRGISQCIFVIYASSSTFISLFINTSNKLSLSVNGAAIKTSSTALNAELYSVEVCYQDGKFDMYLDGVNLGTVSKNITAGTYKMRIGANASGENAFIGKISYATILCDYASVSGNMLRFGD